MLKLADHIPRDPQADIWDVVVIGTGAGGGTAGFNLARLGRSVLFLERGKLIDANSSLPEPSIIESTGRVDSDCPPYGGKREADRNGHPPILAVGCGLGGSTSLFSMVMDRFRLADLEPRCAGHVPPSTSLPDAWPIQCEDLEPYYREAEVLFRVRGSDDPLTSTQGALRAPLAASETETVIHDTLARSGLHPYRLHYAREHVPGCDGCPGKLCARNCRNDAGRMCVLPALEHHAARIFPECRVVKLELSGRTVRQAICFWNNRYIAIRARVFVLALNALLTPALLLRSANGSFPEGLGNGTGMVGRNLMLHVSDYVRVRFKTLHGLLNGLLHNGLSVNDFYVHNGFKLGNIHAHAVDLTNHRSFLGVPIDDPAGTVVFNTIVEDFPYVKNRVSPKPGCDDAVLWEYTYPAELRTRSQMLVSEFANSLQAVCDVSVREPSGLLNPSHMCGTCRFGDDPGSSVLDRNNRIHDLDNTYVLDASFFPSSGGINPSLTIAANSLRVSTLIAKR